MCQRICDHGYWTRFQLGGWLPALSHPTRQACFDIDIMPRCQLATREMLVKDSHPLSLSTSDIERLWHTSNERYMAPSAVALEAIGPRYSQWQDFPEEPGQVGPALVLAGDLRRPVSVS